MLSLCWFFSEFWLLLFLSEPWSSLCLGVRCIFPRTPLRKEEAISLEVRVVYLKELCWTLNPSYQNSLLYSNRRGLPGKAPLYPDSMRCSVTNATGYGLERGRLRLTKSTLVKLSPSQSRYCLEWNLMLTARHFYRGREEGSWVAWDKSKYLQDDQVFKEERVFCKLPGTIRSLAPGHCSCRVENTPGTSVVSSQVDLGYAPMAIIYLVTKHLLNSTPDEVIKV